MDREDREDRLERASTTEEVTCHRLGCRKRYAVCGGAHDGRDGASLNEVTHLGGRGVRVDVHDVLGVHARVLQSIAHGADLAVASGFRGRDVVAVGAQANASYLGVHTRAASSRVLRGLEDHNSGALTDDKAITVYVIWARRAGWVVVA